MRNLVSLTALVALIVIGLAGATSAQVCTENTCVPAVGDLKQGVHSQFDGSADAILWPPNHKLRTVEISAVNEDGEACDVTINDVRQDEPTNGEGSGNTPVDAANCDNSCNNDPNPACVDLRGERSGTLKTGRYYHILYTMDDPNCELNPMPEMGDARVLVPHDQGVAHMGLWVDEGPIYDSDGSADATISCTP